MKELRDTINLMRSGDYKARFIAEYWKVKIRYDKLVAMLEKWDRGELDFKPICPKELYKSQSHFMKCYIEILETRAKLEDVDLDNKANFNYKEIVEQVLNKWKTKDFVYMYWVNFKEDLKASIEKEYKLSVDFRKADFRGILVYCKEVWYEYQKDRK